MEETGRWDGAHKKNTQASTSAKSATARSTRVQPEERQPPAGKAESDKRVKRAARHPSHEGSPGRDAHGPAETRSSVFLVVNKICYAGLGDGARVKGISPSTHRGVRPGSRSQGQWTLALKGIAPSSLARSGVAPEVNRAGLSRLLESRSQGFLDTPQHLATCESCSGVAPRVNGLWLAQGQGPRIHLSKTSPLKHICAPAFPCRTGSLPAPLWEPTRASLVSTTLVFVDVPLPVHWLMGEPAEVALSQSSPGGVGAAREHSAARGRSHGPPGGVGGRGHSAARTHSHGPPRDGGAGTGRGCRAGRVLSNGPLRAAGPDNGVPSGRGGSAGRVLSEAGFSSRPPTSDELGAAGRFFSNDVPPWKRARRLGLPLASGPDVTRFPP